MNKRRKGFFEKKFVYDLARFFCTNQKGRVAHVLGCRGGTSRHFWVTTLYHETNQGRLDDCDAKGGLARRRRPCTFHRRRYCLLRSQFCKICTSQEAGQLLLFTRLDVHGVLTDY